MRYSQISVVPNFFHNGVPYLRAFLLISCMLLPVIGFAQETRLVHKARTSVIIPGLRREFKAELAKLSLEVNPGWKAEEIENDSEHIYQLHFTNPEDSTKQYLSLLMEHYESKGFDSAKWNKLKNSIRESYGDRRIALRPLSEKITDSATRDSSGIIARYELLAKHDNYLEYINAVVGKTSLLLMTVPFKFDEYGEKIGYFRDIAESIKLN